LAIQNLVRGFGLWGQIIILNRFGKSLSIGLSHRVLFGREPRAARDTVGLRGQKKAQEKAEDLVDVAQTFG
jgi:hypothetical protein